MTAVDRTADGELPGVVGTVEETLTRYERRVLKISLAGGFWLVAAAILIAHSAPADGYEVSLYAATPSLYWLLAGAAATVAVGVLVYAPRSTWSRLAVLLAGLCVATTVGLPLVRGYYFYGLADALNHLGWSRKIASGVRPYFSLLYPGSHGFVVFVHQFTGWTFPRSSMFVVFSMGAVFFAFVPLSVAALVRDRRAVYVAAVVAFLLMPINNISTVYLHHTFSLATLFSPLVIYLLVKHVTRGAEDTGLPGFLSGTTFPLALAAFAILLYHPQASLDVLILFVAIAGLQLVFRWRYPDHPISQSRAIYGQALLLVVLFAWWTTQHWQLYSAVENTTEALSGFFVGESSPAPEVGERADAGGTIGFSIAELFAKLFLVEVAFCVLTAGLVLSRLWSGLRSEGRTIKDELDATILLFGVAGIALVPFITVQMIGQISHYFFRHLGFAMVVASILGSVALFGLVSRLGTHLSGIPGKRVVFVVLAVAVLAASLATVYPSPFVYKYNQHATEAHMDGYQAAFEHQPEDGSVWFGSIRGGFSRYENALSSAPGASWYPGIVYPFAHSSGPVPPERLAANLTGYYENHSDEIVRRDHYLPVTEAERERELTAYRGYRFNQSQFDGLEHQPRVHRVRSNGDFTLYYADVATPAAGPDAPPNASVPGDPDAYTEGDEEDVTVETDP